MGRYIVTRFEVVIGSSMNYYLFINITSAQWIIDTNTIKPIELVDCDRFDSYQNRKEISLSYINMEVYRR